MGDKMAVEEGNIEGAPLVGFMAAPLDIPITSAKKIIPILHRIRPSPGDGDDQHQKRQKKTPNIPPRPTSTRWAQCVK